MSVTHLEDFVQLIVKSSSAVLTETAAKAVDGPNWRETLHRLVTRCYAPSSSRSKDKHRSRRRARSACRAKSGDPACLRADQMSFANAVELANSVVSEYSPVVTLYDVLKFKPSSDETQSVSQDEFLHYFDLSLNNNANCNKPLVNKNPTEKLYSTHHPRNLINTPQVPFSSDLGIKLIKERPEISREIHERKVERLERFLQVIPNSDDVEYEVIYNKNVDLESSHFYTFPNRTFHDKNKLTPKARHLLKKYCTPCSVKLLRMDTKKLNCSVALHPVEKPIENSPKEQKENIRLLKNKGIYSESRVVLTDNFRNLNPSFKTLPVKDTSFLTNKTIPKTNNGSRKTRQQNFLKTLTSRNENTIIGVQKNGDDLKNVGSPCVVLQSINNIIKMRGNSTGLKKYNTRNKQVANGKIFRKKVKTYLPRRFSPRLKIANKPLII